MNNNNINEINNYLKSFFECDEQIRMVSSEYTNADVEMRLLESLSKAFKILDSSQI